MKFVVSDLIYAIKKKFNR